MQSLVTALEASGKPILLSGQAVKIHTPPYRESLLFSWAPGNDLPTSPEDYQGGVALPASDTAVVLIHDDDDADQRNRVASNLVKLLKTSGKHIVVDFTEVPLDRVDHVLKLWLKQ